ncbi:MAG: hypothetical protein GC168_11320 [Candidatus Hydrogenedens sp.]|nr:hypothetical protein [Candidatus Hydrogenedens sp.]
MAAIELLDRLRVVLGAADPGDLPGLAEAHGLWQQVASQAAEAGHSRAHAAATRCAELVEEIILDEAASGEASLEAVREALEDIAEVLGGTLEDQAVSYPPLLGVAEPPGTAKTATPSAPPPAPEPAAPEPAPETLPRAKPLTLPDYVDQAIFEEFLSRQPSVLADLEQQALRFEQEGSDGEAVKVFRRLIHTLKGEAGLLALEEVEDLCHLIEDVLDELPAERTVDAVLSAVDWLQRAFRFYGDSSISLEAPVLVNRELNRLRAKDGVTETSAPEAMMIDVPEAGQGAAEESPIPTPVGPPSEMEPEPASAGVTPEEVAAVALATRPSGRASLSPHEIDSDLVFTAGPLTADLSLLGEFVAESREHLQAAEIHLLSIETDPRNMDALNAVFRAFHTIKGVAGFLDLPEIGTLAHVAEDLLDQARKGQRLLDGAALDVVFESVDCVAQLLDNIQSALETNSDLVPDIEVPGLVMALRRMLSGQEPAREVPVDEGEAPTERVPLGQALVDAGVITQETLQAALNEQAELSQFVPKLGEILREQVLLSQAQLDQALISQRQADERQVLGEVLVGLGFVPKDAVEAALLHQKSAKAPKLGEILLKQGQASAQQVRKVLAAQRRAEPPRPVEQEEAPEAAGPRTKTAVREPVKVDAQRLDQLIDMIGELVIAESMVTQFPGVRAIKDARFSQRVSLLDKITRELQEMATGLRMVPVRATFQKMSRIVRDVAKKSGKEVVLQTAGEDTELDKTVIDRIGDPLVHMVRNAVDHGLEATSADRVAAGKPATGNVYLRAFHQGGNIHVQIEDDGRGLNHDAILSKARERGLIGEGETLNDREIAALIFEPGFSTAKVVSEISGRGVGMDVVKKNITDLRGRIEIDSKPGRGSVFTIILPLTLAIIDGMVIRVGTERLIIPTLSIVVSLRPRAEDLITVLSEGEMFKMQGMLYPLVRVHELFDIKEAVQSPTEGIIVVVEINGRRVGLLVDEILGQQQTVIKSLGAQLRGVPGIAGGAIMPDGRVGLIMDVQSLLLQQPADTTA